MQAIGKLPRAVWILATVTAFCAGPAAAQIAHDAPAELEGIGVSEHANAQVPPELRFTDSSGKPVALKEFFDGRQPVLLTMNYSNCPMLCNLQLTGLFDGLGAMEWNLGQNFRMVTVSIDPKELPERAAQTKEHYLETYGRPGSAAAWNVLVGNEQAIKRLADTVGFKYRYVPETNQYAHAAVTMVLTPEGRVSKYLYGVEYDPQTLKFALLEAGQGKIGTTLDQMILYCFHYDPESHRYGPAAVKIMRAGGVATVVFLAGIVLIFWRRGGHVNDAPPAEGGDSAGAPPPDSTPAPRA